MTDDSLAVRWVRGVATVVGLVSAVALLGIAAPRAGAASPTLTITPSSGGHPYQNGVSLDISVGTNSTFAPYSRIIVIECAAPKGVMPVDDTTCDGNTVQSGSVLVNADGSFEVPSYRLYSLPNTALGEAPDSEPVCNSSVECVLYIGQDQNDFSQPKIFSAPFTVDPSATSTPTTAARRPPPGKRDPSIQHNRIIRANRGTRGIDGSSGSATPGSCGAPGAAVRGLQPGSARRVARRPTPVACWPSPGTTTSRGSWVSAPCWCCWPWPDVGTGRGRSCEHDDRAPPDTGDRCRP